MTTDVKAPPTWELLERIRRGDRTAGNLLCERYGPRVLRIVRRFLKNRPRRKLETEDLVQSSLREVFAHLDRFTYRGEGAFVKWLGTVVESKIRSTVRHWASSFRNPEREVPAEISLLPCDGPSPSQEARGSSVGVHRHHDNSVVSTGRISVAATRPDNALGRPARMQASGGGKATEVVGRGVVAAPRSAHGRAAGFQGGRQGAQA